MTQIHKKLEDETICIYCRNTGYSREHVAPASIGGNCIIRCVCKKCNTDLSIVDKGIAEHSAVAFTKIAETPVTSFQTQLDSPSSFRSEALGRISVRVSNQMQTDVRPQMFLVGNTLKTLAVDREAILSMFTFIDKRIAQGRLAQTFIKIDAEQPVPSFCMNRSDEAVVTAITKDEGLRLLSTIEKDWVNIRPQYASAKEERIGLQQEIALNLTLKPNDEFRGIAKVAFETLALLDGPETVLDSDLDPIREYIRGDVRLPEVADGQIRVDPRFVRPLDSEGQLKFTEKHAVLILKSPQGIVAYVTLYGEHRYFVKLATATRGPASLKMYEFSYTRDGHEELDELQIMKRLLELGPQAFGMSQQEAEDVIKQLNEPSPKLVRDRSDIE